MERRFVAPSAPFSAQVTVPGDKSLSHRALILAAMAEGRSLIAGLGPGADVAATRSALGLVGVATEGDEVRSPGVDRWRPPAGPIDAGNSGTTLRLLAGAVCARDFVTVLDGDASLRRRPMQRLVAPLAALGGSVETSLTGTAPLRVRGRPLRGATVSIPLPSAQVRSAVALAALQAVGATVIESPPGFRDHTERWLAALGRGTMVGPASFRVDPGPIPPLEITIPGDPSAAAFLWVAAAITGGSVRTPGVSLNPGRTGLLDVIRSMGCDVAVEPGADLLGDPVGTVTVSGRVHRAAKVDGVLAGRTVDELPLVALLGACASGTTVVADAAELRAKESDRIAATVAAIRALGGSARPTPDGFFVDATPLRAGAVASGGDHRIAMLAAVAAAAAGSVTVTGYEAVAVSWPGFGEALEAMWSSR